jgi:hypothetical protein
LRVNWFKRGLAGAAALAVAGGALGGASAMGGPPSRATVLDHMSAVMARHGHAAAAKKKVKLGGAVLGGVTTVNGTASFPVIFKIAKNGRSFTQAVIGLRLNCTAGGTISLADGYKKVGLSKKRRFAASFADQPQPIDNGQTITASGNMSGSINRKLNRVTGKWHLVWVVKDAAGTVADTCDSGQVPFTATQ